MKLDWSTELGKSDNAITDGGKWPFHADFSKLGLMEVVSSGPNGKNCLKIQQRGEKSENLQVPVESSISTDFSVSIWFKNDDTSASGDHCITCDFYKYINLTLMKKFSAEKDWYFVIGAWITDSEYRYPVSYWRPLGNLEHNKWYRLIYNIHFVDANHIQIFPKIVDESGLVLYDETTFVQSDYLNTKWNNKNDWTLDTFYKAGNNFHIDPVQLQQFSVGNNGQRGAEDTGKFWYVADIDIKAVDTIQELKPGKYKFNDCILIVSRTTDGEQLPSK